MSCSPGRPPFRAETPLDTLLQVLDSEPVAPRLLNPNLPRDLETICLKALRKEPANRYASALAFADDIRRFISDEPISARPQSELEKALRWLMRHPAIGAIGALILWWITLSSLRLGDNIGILGSMRFGLYCGFNEARQVLIVLYSAFVGACAGMIGIIYRRQARKWVLALLLGALLGIVWGTAFAVVLFPISRAINASIVIGSNGRIGDYSNTELFTPWGKKIHSLLPACVLAGAGFGGIHAASRFRGRDL